jgi:amidase
MRGARPNRTVAAMPTMTASQRLDATLERIERLDPQINAFRAVTADSARADAAAAEARLDAGETGPLLGVPIAVKDNVDLAGELTCHGTGAVIRPAERDSEAVRRLRAAGAVIVGKTHLPELAIWGHFTESETYGATRNPWNPERTAAGSSGGSAAAVAAGIVDVALGSDGGGSIRIPSATCGVFGLKPTRDLVPLAPDDGHWNGLTVLGPIARTTRDAALFLDALTDGGYAEAAAAPPRALRIAVSTRCTLPGVKLDAERGEALERTAALLREVGHTVTEQDPRYGFLLGEIMPPYLAGVAQDLDRLDAPEKVEARTASMAGAGRRLSGRMLRRALRRRPQVTERINAIFEDHDVVLTPVTAQPPQAAGASAGQKAFRTFNSGSPYVGWTAVWNVVGNPAASIPAGLDADGLPMAVQAIARPGDDATLLALASQLEAARPWAARRPPVA